MVFNAQKALVHGYTLDEIPHPTPYTFFTNLVHPDDYMNTMKSMRDNMNNITPVYEVEYRIKAKDGSWKWFYDRGLDTVGRYLGEEFLVILPNTDLDNAQKASERIRYSIENTVFEDVGKVTISGGYVEYNNESIEELIDLADQNLYKAKSTGKNNVYGNLQK